MSLGRRALVKWRVASSHQNRKLAGSHRLFVNINLCLFQGAPFDESNTNLSLWQASLSSSYMCNKEQNCSITGNLSVFTFNLRVQPFAVKDGVFNTGRRSSNTTRLFALLYPLVCSSNIAKEILSPGHLEGVHFIQKASSILEAKTEEAFAKRFVLKDGKGKSSCPSLNLFNVRLTWMTENLPRQTVKSSPPYSLEVEKKDGLLFLCFLEYRINANDTEYMCNTAHQEQQWTGSYLAQISWSMSL